MSTSTHENGDSIDFNEISQSTWMITEPGILSWESTNIDIVCDFIGPVIYYVRFNKNRVAVGFTLEDAKEAALKLSKDIIEMGYEL